MQNAQFLSLMDRMIPEGQLRTLCRHFKPTPRTARKLSTEQPVTVLVFHQLQPGGTLADHSTRLHGIRMSDSACAQRRQNLPVELFEQIMDSALGPLATATHHPDSFFEGYRLLGMPPTAGNRALLDRLNEINDALGLERMKALDPLKRGAGDFSFVADKVDGLIGFGAVGQASHAPGETVDLSSFDRRIKRTALLMARLAQDRR